MSDEPADPPVDLNPALTAEIARKNKFFLGDNQTTSVGGQPTRHAIVLTRRFGEDVMRILDEQDATIQAQQKRIENLERALVGLRDDFREFISLNRATLSAAQGLVRCR